MDLLDTLYNQSMPVRDGLLDIRNRLARIEVLWASLGAARFFRYRGGGAEAAREQGRGRTPRHQEPGAGAPPGDAYVHTPSRRRRHRLSLPPCT